MMEINYVYEMILHYHSLFSYCRILEIVCGGICVILFMLFDIRNVVGELTGISAKKEIHRIELQNKSDSYHMKKGVFETGRSLSWEISNNNSGNKTVVLDENEDGKTRVLEKIDENATRVLNI